MSDTPNTRLTRDKSNSMIAGVCAGISARYGYDVGLVRLVAVLLTVLTSGVGVIIYIAAWVLLPNTGAVPPASMGDRRREFSEEVSAAAERAAEAARIAANHARQAADEIAAVARGVSQTAAVEPVATPPPAAEPVVDPTVPSTAASSESVDPPAAGPLQP